ncbi:hypothetical protein ECANGB1_2789 [Enterospora canceri]|uniref:Uncharacterized protein n=1 Tax=Enterospora canceri TaxID=1081671 RepID=A0A1Y1S9F2_9MICR|nr:hypothetical protein ECANGB1_2789 [Enterospora canceri]
MQTGLSNMNHHESQLKWYRYIWIFASNYMIYNTFTTQ